VKRAALALILTSASITARAEDAASCADRFEQAQIHQREGRLVPAKADAESCASESCPGFLRDECRKLALSIDESLASTVVAEQEPRVEVAIAAPEPVAPVSAKPESRSMGIPALAWSGFAVGGAALVAGVVTGAIALSHASACKDNGCTSDELDQGVAIAHASTASFVVAGAGIAAGIVGLFIALPNEAETSAMLSIGPSGAAVGWSW